MAKKLKDLKDEQVFRLSHKSKVEYELNTLDHKKKTAVYTSLKSGKTFKSGWGKTVVI